MKYLKKFNESSDLDTESELRNFCEENLSYIMDDIDLKVSTVIHTKGNNSYTYCDIRLKGKNVEITFEDDDDAMVGGLVWQDIKNDFIPFIELLDEKYLIHEDDITFERTDFEHCYFHKESIINDEIDSRFNVYDIAQIRILIDKN